MFSERETIRTTAVVIEVGDRFFRGLGKKGQIQTAWSLAGAKLFLKREKDEIARAEAKLRSKGYLCFRRNVGLI